MQSVALDCEHRKPIKLFKFVFCDVVLVLATADLSNCHNTVLDSTRTPHKNSSCVQNMGSLEKNSN